MTSEQVLEALAASIAEGDEQGGRKGAEAALAAGIDPQKVLTEGLVAAMRTVGDRWKANVIFLPEVMMAVEAWNAAMEVVEPHLSADAKAGARRGVVVIGTVKGDIHDIGKNIVATLLRTAGFEVHDLGTDLTASYFVAEAERVKADIIAASALMTTTVPGQRDIVEYLQTIGKRGAYFYIVGGGGASQAWADEIGADAYGDTAEDAVRGALELMGQEQESGKSN
jgi:dimethylamine corrinoid protein